MLFESPLLKSLGNMKNISLKKGVIYFGIISFMAFIFIIWLIINGFYTGEIYVVTRGSSANVYANIQTKPFTFYWAVISYVVLSCCLAYGVLWSLKYYKNISKSEKNA